MKLHVFLVLVIMFILFSCSNDIETIDVKNIKSSCECAHAAEKVINEKLNIREETLGKELNEIDTAKMLQRIRTYKKKEEEIIKHCKDKLAIGKCPEWKRIQEKLSERKQGIDQKSKEEAMKKND